MDKVTVITVCYNAEAEIEATMRSVCEQDYPLIEYLIIDGASEDKTLEISERVKREYSDRVGLELIIHSERDKGIYDAMNKGVDFATGKWILFMNAGDQFPKATIVSDVFSHYAEFRMLDGVYGDTIRIRNEKETFVEGRPLAEIKDGFPLPFCHQSIFVRIELLRKHHFDLRYKQAGDYNFFVQAYLDGKEFYHVPVVVSRYLMGGVSETNNIKHWEEKIQIREESGLEKFSPIKKRMILGNYTLRHKIKRLLPKRVLQHIIH